MCCRAARSGRLICSADLYRTDSAGKACQWSYGMVVSNTYDDMCMDSPDLIIVQALPDDLKSKLSLDEDLVFSPKDALLPASADRVAMRNKNLKRCNPLMPQYFRAAPKTLLFLLLFLIIFIHVVETSVKSWLPWLIVVIIYVKQRYGTFIFKSKGQELIQSCWTCCK